MKKKVYISGPISGFDMEERKEAFKKAEKILKRKGFIPVNPLENGLDEKEPWILHMKADIKMLLECDAIYLMTGWRYSRGCRIEYNIAVNIGFKLIFENL